MDYFPPLCTSDPERSKLDVFELMLKNGTLPLTKENVEYLKKEREKLDLKNKD